MCISSTNISFECCMCSSVQVPYFFSYKMELFSFQNDLEDVGLSYKTDLDLWNFLGRVKLIVAKFHRTDLVIGSHSREENIPSYSQIDMIIYLFGYRTGVSPLK